MQGLYRDAQGIVWIGTDRGMTALPPGGSTRAWLGQPDFPGQNAFDFLRDASGDVWIASDRGLLRLRGDSFRVYDHRVGLPRDKEFLLAVTGLDAAQARALCERMRQRPAAIDIDAHGANVLYTASMGMAMSDEAPSRRELLALADRRLYQAKRQGRDRLAGP